MSLLNLGTDANSYTTMLGLSYGTTLGATVAAMFPDRIDKLILDGVMNPHEYYHSLAYVMLLPIMKSDVESLHCSHYNY